MGEALTVTAPLDINQIRQVLPHRWPFILIDRVLELEPGKSAKAIKAVSAMEPWVPGHFPHQTIMPGVLMIESIAQTAAVMFLSQPHCHGKPAVLAGVNDLRFRRVVVPGDVLTIDVQMISFRMGVGKVSSTVHVDGELAIKGQLQFAFLEG